MMPSDYLQRMIDGEITIDEVPEGMRQGVSNMFDLWAYKKADWVLSARGGIEDRRARLATFPELTRPAIAAWVTKLFYKHKASAKLQ